MKRHKWILICVLSITLILSISNLTWSEQKLSPTIKEQKIQPSVNKEQKVPSTSTADDILYFPEYYIDNPKIKKPDLTVKISVPNQASLKSPIMISVTVSNIGKAKSFKTYVNISRYPPRSGRLIKKIQVPELEINKSFNTSVQLPVEDLSIQEYRIYAYVDPDKLIDESKENNNSHSDQINIIRLIRLRPD